MRSDLREPNVEAQRSLPQRQPLSLRRKPLAPNVRCSALLGDGFLAALTGVHAAGTNTEVLTGETQAGHVGELERIGLKAGVHFHSFPNSMQEQGETSRLEVIVVLSHHVVHSENIVVALQLNQAFPQDKHRLWVGIDIVVDRCRLEPIMNSTGDKLRALKCEEEGH